MPGKKTVAAARPSACALTATVAADEGEPATHETVLQQFRIVLNAVKAHFQQVERKAGIGGAQLWALSIVREQPGIGVKALAAALNVRQPTASIIVRNLSQQGLVVAGRDGPDRRSVQLHIAAEGRKVLKRAPGPFSGVLPEALKALDPATLNLLTTALAQLILRLDTDDRAATTPLSGLLVSD